MLLTKRYLKLILDIGEPLVLLITTFFFWYPTPNSSASIEQLNFDRADYFWLLGVIAILIVVRFIVHGRFWTATPLDNWFYAFLALGVLNVRFAPYESRGVMMLARPVLGMLTVLYFAEVARERRSMFWLLVVTLLVSLGLGLTAIGTTQWREKSLDFLFILERLPQFDLFYARGGFNPNEIAGAIAWLIPVTAGLTLYPWKKWQRILQGLSWIAFLLLLFSLILGQSRAAILGVIIALIAFVLTVVPRGRPRYLSLIALAFLIVMELAVVMNIFPQIGGANLEGEIAQAGLSRRDERTTNQRFDIWTSALHMIEDYPLTGVGMNRFRYSLVRHDYPVPDFDYPANPENNSFTRRIIPHAHNMFVQVTTDLGIPGLIVFIGWNLVIVWMLWKVWLVGDYGERVLAVTFFFGGAAHVLYGLGDAIPLWDRFIFIYWIMVGLSTALYTKRFFPDPSK